MPKVLDWLRRLDAALLSAGVAVDADTEDGAVWPAFVAVVGGLLVVAAALLLASHAALQLLVISGGLLLTIPFLQDRWDKAAAAVRE